MLTENSSFLGRNSSSINEKSYLAVTREIPQGSVTGPRLVHTLLIFSIKSKDVQKTYVDCRNLEGIIIERFGKVCRKYGLAWASSSVVHVLASFPKTESLISFDMQ